MNQTESSMSEGYSFFNNLSAGSDKINSVSRDCANRSSSSISSSPSSTSYFIVYNNNNVITKDHPPPLQKQYLRSQKGLRSPHHLQQSQQNHMSTLSWSSASCDSSEISYDSINSDSTNESTTKTTTITTAPSSSSTTSTTTTTTTTSTTTTSSTQQHQQQPTKSDTTTSNTTTTSNAPTNGQLVSTLCVASRDSTLTTSTQPISTPTKTSAHQQHINSENRKPGYLPCTPTPRSFRYPSFISFNHISSEMGRPNSYDSFEYQQYQQYQQFVQQQQQKYQQQLLQNISDDNEGCVSDQHDETSNQQKQQQSSSISDIEPQEQQQQQSNQESSSSSTENQSTQLQESCSSSSNETLSSQPQQEQEKESSIENENESQQHTPSTTVLKNNSTSLVTSASSSSASENESSSEDEMELPENCHYSPPKSVDRDAASRLAKRLYNLEGFKRSDVCRHLSKNNDFSRIVAEEYLKFFNFEGDTLDGALRKFLFSFCLIGETQERERVLQHFSKRYLDCNPDTIKSADALHTLTCAIMLLNTDLHGENVGRKMTCNEFIDNLSDLNDGQNFPRDVLVSIYQSIKAQPLKWALDEDAMVNGVNSRIGLFGSGLSSSSVSSSSSSSSGHLSPGGILGSNPFLKLPNPNTATEYKRGYIMRKCCFDMNGKKTPFGKRGWKMFYATLRDLVLFLHKDEQGGRKNQLYESLNNSIRIHHAMAAPATDYTKKQYVFRLQTADQSEYLFQTSDAQELQSWIDTINLVAGTLSAPPLPSAVGSQSKKFQKPLLPSSHTKFNTKEQLADHEVRIQRIAQELEEHVSKHPDKGAQRRLLNEYAEKQSYLEFELKRYSAYASILRTKLQQVLGSGALLEGPNKSMTPLSSKSKPLTQLSIGEEQDIDEEKWAEDGHEYQEQISVQPVKRSHR